MQGVTFGIFGLGNKQYEHFCAVGKRIHTAMLSLGAAEVVKRGDGDDDEDIEADFDKWREQLFAALDKSRILGGSLLTKVNHHLLFPVAILQQVSSGCESLLLLASQGATPSTKNSPHLRAQHQPWRVEMWLLTTGRLNRDGADCCGQRGQLRCRAPGRWP